MNPNGVHDPGNDQFGETCSEEGHVYGCPGMAGGDHERRETYCDCGDFVPDSSGDAGCGNCGADEPPFANREGQPEFNGAFR